MQGDDLVAQPRILTKHAITIEAQSAEVWPWPTRMRALEMGGYHPRRPTRHGRVCRIGALLRPSSMSALADPNASIQ
jgi:hypothetical protein